jgi:hypothetical protein
MPLPTHHARVWQAAVQPEHPGPVEPRIAGPRPRVRASSSAQPAIEHDGADAARWSALRELQSTGAVLVQQPSAQAVQRGATAGWPSLGPQSLQDCISRSSRHDE